jgi:hypothetical protein
LRWSVAPSPWDLARYTYSPITLARADILLERFRQWLGLLYYLAGVWWVWGVLGCIAWWRAALWLRILPARVSPAGVSSYPYATVLFLLCMGWSALFVAGHWLVTLQIWDRYLLPLAPMLALGVGWLLASGAREANGQDRQRVLPLLLFVFLLIWPAWAAAQGRLPVGADHGDYAGLHEALRWLDAHGEQGGGAPSGERYVLYHQVFGWHLPFYLYGEMRGGQVTARWFPSSTALADHAAKTPYPPKYLLLPAWAPLPDAPLHLRMRRMTWETRLVAEKMRIMEIVRLPQAACDWCVCMPKAQRAVETATETVTETVTETIAVQGLRLVQVGQAGMMSQP